MEAETYAFQAEINQLLSLIIHTFYSKKEVFLRELISNASDALDRATARDTLKIQILANSDSSTLTIIDSGIGMTKSDLVNNLGNIAQSGSRRCIEETGTSLIGQFGVGFYSAFLVADKITVHTKHARDVAYTWESTASGSFTISQFQGELTQGTRVILHLKEDQLTFLDARVLSDLVKKNSEYVQYPIYQWENDTWQHLNPQEPVWLRPRESVTDADHAAFYQSFARDWEPPTAYTHLSVEGAVTFKGVLYIPKRPPPGMFEHENRSKNGIKLYVRRIFVTDQCESIVPEYLSFLSGVIDCEDLPLNVSRESIQQSTVICTIRKHIVKKALEMFDTLALGHADVYRTFYSTYSKSIKLGIHEDSQNRQRLVNLLRYQTNKSDWSSLHEIKSRMSTHETRLNYIAGESYAAVSQSACIESLVAHETEVIFMCDPIDEFAMQQISEYDGVPLVSATKSSHDTEALSPSQRRLCSAIKDALGNGVHEVKLSTKLVQSPCVVVSSEHGWSANMDRIMRAQALNTNQHQHLATKKVFEINTTHSIITDIEQHVIDKKSIADTVQLLYSTALVMSGFAIEQPAEFGRHIFQLIATS